VRGARVKRLRRAFQSVHGRSPQQAQWGGRTVIYAADEMQDRKRKKSKWHRSLWERLFGVLGAGRIMERPVSRSEWRAWKRAAKA
jgi:hypothetical protein